MKDAIWRKLMLITLVSFLLACPYELISECEYVPPVKIEEEVFDTKSSTLETSLKFYEVMTIDSLKELIGERESGGCSFPYKVVNRYGMLGKYQFSKKTLRGLGLNSEGFLSDSVLQEHAMDKLLEANYRYIVRNDLYLYIGEEIGGLTITLSGMLASMHLLGPASVRDYLTKKGDMSEYLVTYVRDGVKITYKIRKKDGNGTSIKNYLSILS